MALSRRRFLNGAAMASGAAAVVGGAGLRVAAPAGAKSVWPDAAAWEALNRKVGGRLMKLTSPLASCTKPPLSPDCRATLDAMNNPFWIQEQPWAQQCTGWLDAWTAEVSPYAVAATSAADVAAAVDFARETGVKLVVKGAGHDYKGRNCAPNSLLVWTGKMRDVTYHPDFRIAGATASVAGRPAVSAQAGARWIEGYTLATQNNRYIQGGGCTTVGMAGGFLQGGGYGSFTKRFGTGAGGVLEFEVVTADGKVRIANERQNPDLFWALRGGGGGTFGIVTRVTLMAHEMPRLFGLMRGRISAANDAAFKDLIGRFAAFFADRLNNPTWGEQIAVRGDNSLDFFMTYLDLTEEEARAVWKPFLDGLAARPKEFSSRLTFLTTPFRDVWNAAAWERREPGFMKVDTRPEARPNHFWVGGNDEEVAAFLDTYQSRWLPRRLFEPAGRGQLVETLFAASRHAHVRMQINKGLHGASPESHVRDRTTSIHPAVFDASTIVIISVRHRHTIPGVPGHEPDLAEGRRVTRQVDRAMKIIRDATPESATYGNESDYFEADWKREFYGPHYARLLAIKRKYDPANLFKVHHGVGSDL